MTPSDAKIKDVLTLLEELELTPVDFVISLISHPHWKHHASDIFYALNNHWKSHQSIRDYVAQDLCSEIISLTNKKQHFEFVATSANEDRMQEITIQSLAAQMSSTAPQLWNLLDHLFSADSKLNRKRDLKRQASGQNILSKRNSEASLGQHTRDLLIPIKKVICISMMLHSTNQQCNALQSIIGVFLHSCGTPEAVREFLAHVGLSIAPRSIDICITSLSKEVGTKIRLLGQSFNALYAYDNLDIDLKHTTPTLEQSGGTLIHLTTALMMPLAHGTTDMDLHCAREVWEILIRDQSSHAKKIPSQISFKQLAHRVHPENEHSSGLTRRGHYIKWLFLRDIIDMGPQYFHSKFRSKLVAPEVVLGIPVSKTTQVPMRAMDIKPDTPANNASALDLMFSQSGIGDPNEHPHVRDVKNRVLLIFGDLLTGQHIQSLQETRVLEGTAWRQFQPIVFTMGLFHLKMACADAIWKLCIVPQRTHDDPTSLMSFVKKMRPKETVKIETNPGFRRMHEVIQHVGQAMRLDLWRQRLDKKGFGQTIEEVAERSIQWDDLVACAHELALEYERMPDISALRNRPADQRDGQQENILLLHDYFLWYEEMSYALNEGDIGRVESLFIHWMHIFRGCGKHKYAAELRRYLENMFFHFPDGLQKAIRMNILCNPTGKKGAFRAIDWVVEHNNLYIKRIYGGKSSNHTKQRILDESALIGIYKGLRMQFEDMFHLDHKTTKHSGPDMTVTFRKVSEYIQEVNTNEYIAGRTTAYMLTDAMTKGMTIEPKKKKMWIRTNEDAMEVDEPEDYEDETMNLGADIEPDDFFD